MQINHFPLRNIPLPRSAFSLRNIADDIAIKHSSLDFNKNWHFSNDPHKSCLNLMSSCIHLHCIKDLSFSVYLL